MDETVIRLRDRRVEMRSAQEWAGQGAAALALLSAGTAGLEGRSPGPAWVPMADVAVGVFLAAAIVREVRATRAARKNPDHHAAAAGIGWVSLLGGAACFLEWGSRLPTGGKVVSVMLLTGIVNLAQGIFQPFIERRRNERRYVRLSDEGLDARLSRLRHFQAPWSGVERVERDAAGLVVHARDGRRCRLSARRYRNFAALEGAIVCHAAAHQVRVTGEPHPTPHAGAR
jgi:hypothetical protein